MSASPPRKEPPGTHWLEGWEGLRTCLGDLERTQILLLLGLELRHLGRPARSQPLYRLLSVGKTKCFFFSPQVGQNNLLTPRVNVKVVVKLCVFLTPTETDDCGTDFDRPVP
jgi:hypothetical protein